MTVPARPATGDAERGVSRRPGPVSRLRSSLLLKILAGLIVTLVGASAFTAFLEERLTRHALATQARRVTDANLRLLNLAYTERERTLIGTLRNLGQFISVNHLETDRNQLVQELGRAQGNLQLDHLSVVQHDGSPMNPPVVAGSTLGVRQVVSPHDRRSPVSRLLPTSDGRWVQAVVVPVNTAERSPMLVGGYEFGDAFAYGLRRQLRDTGHVILVADSKVVASTLVDPLTAPPGLEPGGTLAEPTIGRLRDGRTLVGYHPTARSSQGSLGAPGALGVSLADPERPLDIALDRTRLLAAVVLALVALALGSLFFRALVRPLVSLKQTAGRIAAGNLEASFAVAGSDEIAQLARSLEQMRLELRIQLDLIAHQAADLRESSQRIVAAQDEERHRLARDLHDGIQQHLVVLRMGLGMAKEAAERSSGPAVGLDELGRELDAVIEMLREVSHDLYPSILVDRGLMPALRTSLGRLPVPARLICAPDPLPRLPPEIESGAYFLVGEALANALKHAAASEITVRLEVEEGWLTVEVSDDGRGFLPAGQDRHGGLLHMEDRTRSFGGELRITSRPEEGTQVRATFPVRPAAGVT